MRKMKRRACVVRCVSCVVFITCLTSVSTAWSQANIRTVSGEDITRRPIITAVPFLGFAPDARSASLGDVGVATAPDANSTHWNNAKFAFIDNKQGFSFSYTPWLSSLVDDMYVAYLTGYTKLQGMQTVAFSLRYFNLGDIFLTNELGASTGTFSPRDFALDVTYSRKLSERIGLAATMRYVNSGLGRSYVASGDGKSSSGFAVDLGFYYTHPEQVILGKKLGISAGAHLSNVGTKITYGDKSNENFMPTNLRVGTALRYPIDAVNSVVFALDLNKLLVPTPPIYSTDSDGNLIKDKNGDTVIESGNDASGSVVGALFSSFSDAPGGFSEELQEVSLAVGLEYWFKQLFSVQGGYHHESAEKGNRKYFTFGTGFRYNIFGIDFAYLLPVSRNHPLAQTLRFSMYFTLGKDGATARTTPVVPVTSSIDNGRY